MRALVIGTSGQLALELQKAVLPQGVVLAAAQKVEIADEASVVRLLDANQPDLVVNAAAYTAVDRAESEQERAFAVNATGPAIIARWCDAHSAALIHVSTDYVFDGEGTTPYAPNAPTSPVNTYGASKLAGEEAVRGAVPRHVIVRTSWVYSAHGQNFVKTMLRLAAERDELRVVADQIGRPTAARDLAAAIWTVAAQLAQGRDVAWGTHHFAGAGVVSWHGFAEAIVAELARTSGKAPRVIPIRTQDFPTPARRPRFSVLDTTTFEEAFGVVPQGWQDSLRLVLQELRAAES